MEGSAGIWDLIWLQLQQGITELGLESELGSLLLSMLNSRLTCRIWLWEMMDNWREEKESSHFLKARN